MLRGARDEVDVARRARRSARSSCSMDRPTRSWARSVRCLASSTGDCDRARARRTPGRGGRGPRRARPGSARGTAPGGAGRRTGRSRSRRTSAMSMTLATTAGSSRIRRIVPPSVTNRPGASCTPTVSLMMSSSTWASSNTTTSCSGRITPPLPTCRPYRCMLTTTTSAALGAARAASAKQASPSGQRSLPGHSSLPTLTARHAASDGDQSSSAASPVSVVVTHVAMRASSSLVVAARPSSSSWPTPVGVHLAEPLQAHVVAAPLEHRPLERRAQHVLQEREVLAGELVLQRLRRRGDHDRAARRRWPGRGRRASCRCPCRPARRGAGRRRSPP